MLINARQGFLDNVAGSDVYDQDGRDVMLRAGACSVLSTPLRDDRGWVWGMVSTHHNLPQRLPDDQNRAVIQRRADETARLRWYETTVMPAIVVTVHAAAARATTNRGRGHHHRPKPRSTRSPPQKKH